MKHTPKAYWWTEVPNFGDRLAPLLLKRFAYLDVKYSPIKTASIVSVGSVLEHIPYGWRGYVVGSGLLREESKLKFNPHEAKVLALRGPLTAKKFQGNFALGDPGLLANELISYQEKKWDLGIVPHWQDNTLANRFLALIPSKFSCKVINYWEDPITVIEQIASCRRIVTSSLHGMIIADSIGGIPRRFEYCDKLDADGKDFKFRDYSASIHAPFEIGKMYEANRNRVNDIQSEIYSAYRELSRIYEN